jgi:hypothetical protein
VIDRVDRWKGCVAMLGMKERFLLSVAAFGVAAGMISCTSDDPAAVSSREADCVRQDALSKPDNGGGALRTVQIACFSCC